MAITNGAADILARSLALELAPIRVNAVSPGVIDTGAWDALGEQGKADYFADISARNPARRIGTADDIANGVAVRPDQHLPHRPDAAHRRRRAAHLTPPDPRRDPVRASPERTRTMGLSWQQGPLAPGAIGRFLVPDPLPERLLFAEPLRRRMRVRFGGAWIADSEDVVLLHEPGRYPVAYFPLDDITDGVLQPSERTTQHRDLGPTTWYTVQAGGQSSQRAAWQHTELPPTRAT